MPWTYTLDADAMVKRLGGASRVARIHDIVRDHAGFQPLAEQSIRNMVSINRRNPQMGSRMQRVLEMKAIAEIVGVEFEPMDFCTRRPLGLSEAVMERIRGE